MVIWGYKTAFLDPLFFFIAKKHKLKINFQTVNIQRSNCLIKSLYLVEILYA